MGMFAGEPVQMTERFRRQADVVRQRRVEVGRAEDTPDAGMPGAPAAVVDTRVADVTSAVDVDGDWYRAVARIGLTAAEALAFATLATDGHRVRVAGQDTQRGTFSHRHSVVHDVTDGHTYCPLRHLAADQAPVDIVNSPLSEAAALGFEYGYALGRRNTDAAAWPSECLKWLAESGVID